MLDLDTILVADPSPLFRQLLSTMLSPYANKVLATATSQQALEILEAEPVTGLVVNTQFPDGSGFDVAEISCSKQVGSILVSRRWSEGEALQASKLGAVGYLSLPISMRDLRACWKRSDPTLDLFRPRRRRTLSTAWVSDVADAKAPLLATDLHDVGTESAFLITEGPIPLGTQLSIEMLLDGELVRARGRVVRLQEPAWTQVGGVAVAFDDIHPKGALERFIDADNARV